ncbi:MAG: hypothetical protein COA79_01815 [Planctomycetota bacterium]|nr:MAG: hypothetical protein COA79_01815 [Planctomycetota bacterium]
MKEFSFIILGDLHYEEDQQREMVKAFVSFNEIKPEFLVCLGDVGGYTHPGSQQSFDEAKILFETLCFPTYPIIGNHDLEGLEFNTDEENVNAWLKTFDKELPYYSIEHENCIMAFLSTTQFRTNEFCIHEVFINQNQKDWFETLVQNNQDKEIFVFSHAPILGSGIRVIQNIHLMAGNAYLNHAHNPETFIKIVRENANIKFWASGHNHLSQTYHNTISKINQCLFCHTGVIGKTTRDGLHHSRLVTITKEDIKVDTIDHDHKKIIPGAISQQNQKSLQNLKSNLSPKVRKKDPIIGALPYDEIKNYLIINGSKIVIHQNTLVEYNLEAEGPLGIISTDIPDDAYLRAVKDELQVWVKDILIHKFKPKKLNCYSYPGGMRIHEHPLGRKHD